MAHAPAEKRTSLLGRRPVPIWLVAGMSLLLYGILAVWFPLRPYYNVTRSPDINSLASTLPETLAYVGLLLSLFGLLALAYRRLISQKEPARVITLLAAAALFSLPLVFTFPINATDIYRYFVRARIHTVYGESPFEAAPADFPHEPYLALTGEWADRTSPYGPLWELVAYGVTNLAHARLWPALLFFKGLAAFFHLAIGWLIWQILDKSPPGRRSALTLLWVCNPAFLLVFAMDGHNDALMLFWLLFGWWLISKGRLEAGMAVAFLGPLTKPIGVLALPFFFIAGWRELEGWAKRIRFLAISAGAGLALTWLAFSPFGDPLPLVRRLLSEAGSGGGFSPLALIILVGRALKLDLPVETAATVGAALFGALAIALIWLAWRGRAALRGPADLFAAYILTAINFRIWYAVWPFPWLLLDYGQGRQDDRSGPRLIAGTFFLMTSQLSVVIYGYIRVNLFARSHTLGHIVGVPFTMLLPLIAALIAAGGASRLRELRRGR